ncbi:unnamed protein product [Didymodactylos carnosus]|uniref:Uncharacterized protein n=1 Tax=Didymodactylos carnosus TaxID=1234261 RepID=A0A815II24_9BILA|nr:unnamed protein product [Didymodactylos carnosus]CAF4253112.1 unnamed protein product [Didymodactylos carnosus]
MCNSLLTSDLFTNSIGTVVEEAVNKYRYQVEDLKFELKKYIAPPLGFIVPIPDRTATVVDDLECMHEKRSDLKSPFTIIFPRVPMASSEHDHNSCHSMAAIMILCSEV